MRFKVFIALISCTVFMASNASAAIISSVYGTGLDNSHNALALNAYDMHYKVAETGANAQVLSNPYPTYYPNDNNSQWIWQYGNGQPTNVTRSFVTTFDLTGFDYTSAVIQGAWGTDNEGLDILINGKSTGNQLLGAIGANFNTLHNFTISSGFQDGINTLSFIIKDDGYISAFRTKLSGTANIKNVSVPEPSVFSLIIAGFLGLASLRFRKVR
jgi:hypothetical protein